MNAVEAAALALVGAPFRLHGRALETGLDCVGVVALATGKAVPTGYSMRGMDEAIMVTMIEAAGLIRSDHAEPGDIMLMRTGPAQLHLGVKTAAGLVHADAGLGRVVERPGDLEWEVLGSWRRLS